jgi:hypothetical protein
MNHATHHATTAPDVYIPDRVERIDGVWWLTVRCNPNTEDPTAFPRVLRYGGRLHERTGFNSDSGIIGYREASADAIALPA